MYTIHSVRNWYLRAAYFRSGGGDNTYLYAGSVGTEGWEQAATTYTAAAAANW